jgi:hypothetical protein
MVTSVTLSSDQAAETLKEIERTGRRSAHAFSYANASPYFIFWGFAWMAGYAGSALAPQFASQLWIALTAIGIAACTIIGRRQAAARSVEGDGSGLRFLATFTVIFLFVFALFAVIGPPSDPMASGAVAPLIVSMFYCLMGIWKAQRFLIAGVTVAVLTLGGFFLLHPYFLLWMAFVGGSSLVLAGIWLRQA